MAQSMAAMDIDGKVNGDNGLRWTVNLGKLLQRGNVHIRNTREQLPMFKNCLFVPL